MPRKLITKTRENNYKEDMRFLWWVDNMLAPGLVTLKEMGAVFGRETATGSIVPLSSQAIDERVKRIKKVLYSN